MVPFIPRSLIVVCLTCWGLNQLQRVCFKHWYARIVFLKNRFYSCRKFDLLIIFFLIQNFLDNSINISSLIVKFPNYWAKTKLNMLPRYSTFWLEFFSNRNHKALFIWRKVILYRRFTLAPELPWARQLFLRFLTKLGEPFTWQTKISAGGVTHLAGPPVFHDIRTQFPYTNILVRPSGSTRSRRDNQNIHEQCWLR